MTGRTLRIGPHAPFSTLVGVGGIGTGMFLELEGDRTLGRNESRPARLLDARDYCKLHIVAHHVAVLLGAGPAGSPFHVVPVGKVGDDEAGRRLLEEMAATGIDTRYVETVEGRPTLFSVCFQYPDGEGGNMTTVDSAASSLETSDVDRVEPLLASAGRRAIAVAMPEVSLASRRRLLELASAHGALRVASFTSAEIEQARSAAVFASVDLVSLNEDEAGALVRMRLDAGEPDAFLSACADTLTSTHPGIRIVVSAGADGTFAFDGERWHRRPAPPVEVAATAGAGDALLGGVIAGLATGIPLAGEGADDDTLTGALDLGVLLAARTVTSPHAIDPTADVPTLRRFADALGLRVAGPLAEVL